MRYEECSIDPFSFEPFISLIFVSYVDLVARNLCVLRYCAAFRADKTTFSLRLRRVPNASTMNSSERNLDTFLQFWVDPERRDARDGAIDLQSPKIVTCPNRHITNKSVFFSERSKYYNTFRLMVLRFESSVCLRIG